MNESLHSPQLDQTWQLPAEFKGIDLTESLGAFAPAYWLHKVIQVCLQQRDPNKTLVDQFSTRTLMGMIRDQYLLTQQEQRANKNALTTMMVQRQLEAPFSREQLKAMQEIEAAITHSFGSSQTDVDHFDIVTSPILPLARLAKDVQEVLMRLEPYHAHFQKISFLAACGILYFGQPDNHAPNPNLASD